MSTPADFDADQPAIVVENLQRSFGSLKAVDGVSFTINHGSVVGFVGANGAGKTTTMRIMATLDQPTAGSVKVCGHNVVHYPEKVRPGRYIIHSEMGNWELLRKLRNGRQDAYKVVVNHFRLKEDIAGRLAHQTAYDSAAIYAMLDSTELMQQWGFNAETSPAIFVPNTYEVNWTTSFPEFLAKMNKAYVKFWTLKRKVEAQKLGLTPIQVSILASIVYGESKNPKEQARVAGVYWNRLQANMPLQADPTVVFAWKDFTIKRVTSKYTALNSPYNTYKNTGLPPGPISIVPSDVIDKVLHLEHHQFMYFCAKADFSENHAFAVTYEEHRKNASDYQKALDQHKIH